MLSWVEHEKGFINFGPAVSFQPDLLKNVVIQLEKINFVTDRLSLGDAKFMVSLGIGHMRNKLL